MKYIYLVLLAAVMVACASEPATKTASSGTAAPTKPDESNGVICTKEAPAGSIMRKTVCTTPEEREAARRRVEMDTDTVR